MRHIPAITRRELQTLFYSPIAYICLFVFTALTGVLFFLILRHYSEVGATNTPPLSHLWDGFIMWIVFWIMPPALTMRLLAEERKQGTFEALMTAPVSEVEVVVGKWLAAVLFFALMWATTLFYIFMAAYASGADKFPDGLTLLVLFAFLASLLVPLLGAAQARAGDKVLSGLTLLVEVVLAGVLIGLTIKAWGNWPAAPANETFLQGLVRRIPLFTYCMIPVGVIVSGAGIALATFTAPEAPTGDEPRGTPDFLRRAGGWIVWAATAGGFFMWASWTIDVGPVFAGYLGTVALGGVFLSMGVLASALTRDQITAFLVALVFGVMLYLLGFGESFGIQIAWIAAFFDYVAFPTHVKDFAKGVVNTSHLIYYASLIALFLFLSVRAVESQRWR